MSLRVMIYIFLVCILSNACGGDDVSFCLLKPNKVQSINVGEIKEFGKGMLDASQIDGELTGNVSIRLEHQKVDGSMHRMKMYIHNNLSYSIVVMYKEDSENEAFVNKTDIIPERSSTTVYVSYFGNQKTLFDNPSCSVQESIGVVYISKIKIIPSNIRKSDSVDFSVLIKSPERYIDQYITVNGWLRFDNRSLGFCEDKSCDLISESNFLRVEQEGLPSSPVEYRVYASVTGLYTSDFGLIDVKGGGILSHISKVTLFPKSTGEGSPRDGVRTEWHLVKPR